MGLFRRAAGAIAAGPHGEWSARDDAYDHLDDLLACWATQHGHTWYPGKQMGGQRWFGVCEGHHEGTRFEIRGWMDGSQTKFGTTTGVDVRFVTEVRAWVPGPGAWVQKLTRTKESGPYEPDRLGVLYKGDVRSLPRPAAEALLAAAPYATVLRLEHEDGYGRRAPGGLVYVSPRDARLHPSRIEWAGVDLLLGMTVGVARALAT